MTRAMFRAGPPAFLAALATLALVVACGQPFGPPPAQSPNVVDTVLLYSVTDTPLTGPAAYDITIAQPVSTTLSGTFDFFFAGDTTVRFRTDGGGAQLVPTGAVPSLSRGPAFQHANVPFDSVKTAPSGGWNDTTGVAVDSGLVLIARSRPTACSYGAVVYQYAKIEILTVDTTAGTVRLKMMVNQNCGYRDLQPGIPSH